MLKITGKDEVDIGYSQNTHTHIHPHKSLKLLEINNT